MLSHSSGQFLPLLLKCFLPWCLSPKSWAYHSSYKRPIHTHQCKHCEPASGLQFRYAVGDVFLCTSYLYSSTSCHTTWIEPEKKTCQILLFIKSKICCSQQSHFMSGFELAHDRWLWKCQAVFWDMSHQCSIVFYNPLHDLCLYLCRYKTAYLTFPFFLSLSETRRPVHSDSAGRHATWHRIWYEVSVGYGLRAQRFGRSEHPGQQQPGV